MDESVKDSGPIAQHFKDKKQQDAWKNRKEVDCDYCKGSGYLKGKPCEYCFGKGKIIVKEETVTGDAAQTEAPFRKPDGTHSDTLPYFNTDNSEDLTRVANGRKKGEHWKNYISDPGIRNWIKANPVKNFYVNYRGVLIKGR